MGHCKSKRKTVQGSNISNRKSKQKKYTRAHTTLSVHKNTQIRAAVFSGNYTTAPLSSCFILLL